MNRDHWWLILIYPLAIIYCNYLATETHHCYQVNHLLSHLNHLRVTGKLACARRLCWPDLASAWSRREVFNMFIEVTHCPIIAAKQRWIQSAGLDTSFLLMWYNVVNPIRSNKKPIPNHQWVVAQMVLVGLWQLVGKPPGQGACGLGRARGGRLRAIPVPF
jgi:hypothetical protein